MSDPVAGPEADGERPPLSPADCAATLGVSRETLARLETYVAMLEDWQTRKNLIGRGSLGDIWHRHVLDSGQLAAHLPAGAQRLTDLGSGAGFPGLVLAITTGIATDLIESDGGKAAFLNAVIRETDAPATVHNARIEALTPWRTDVLTARALAPLPKLLGYAAPFFRVDGGKKTRALFQKGGKWRDELTDSRKMWHMSAENVPSQTDSDARIVIITELRWAGQGARNRRAFRKR